MIADLRKWLTDPKTTFPAYTARAAKPAKKERRGYWHYAQKAGRHGLPEGRKNW